MSVAPEYPPRGIRWEGNAHVSEGLRISFLERAERLEAAGDTEGAAKAREDAAAYREERDARQARAERERQERALKWRARGARRRDSRRGAGR